MSVVAQLLTLSPLSCAPPGELEVFCHLLLTAIEVSTIVVIPTIILLIRPERLS